MDPDDDDEPDTELYLTEPFACGAAFAVNSKLTRHICTVNETISVIHEGIHKYNCSTCNKSFGQKGNLMKHISVVHEGIKPYQCSICNAKFSFKNDLDKHLVSTVHGGAKSHFCSICGNLFMTNRSLQNHILAVHEKKKPYTCSICANKFAYKNHLGPNKKAYTAERLT